MKIIKNLKFAALAAVAALAVTLLFQIPITRAVAQDGARQDGKHKLHLRVYFTEFHATRADPNVNTVGDQRTFGGTLARVESPDQPIGTFGVQFVRSSTQRGESVGFGTLNLPDGLVSFAGFLDRNPRVPGPITGGTGAYWNARGQIDHNSLAGGVEEFILTFVGN